MADIQGIQGPKGDQGIQGQPGIQGVQGIQGVKGDKGDKGDRGQIGPEGPTGPQGIQGPPGTGGGTSEPGPQGEPGQDGADGLSAYQIAVAAGFVGNEAAWLASLKGDQGIQGEPGQQGPTGTAPVENAVFVSSSSGYLPIDVTGNQTVFYTNLAANVTEVNLPEASDGVPTVFSMIIQFIGTGGAYSVTWPANVRWSGGTSPILSTALNKVDTFTFFTRDAGNTWFAGNFGQAF